MLISNFLPIFRRRYPNLRLSITRTNLYRRQDLELITINFWTHSKNSTWLRRKTIVTMRWLLIVMGHLLLEVKSEPLSKITQKDPLIKENLSGQKVARINMLHLSLNRPIKPQGSRLNHSTSQRVPSLQQLAAIKVSIWISKLPLNQRRMDLNSRYSRRTRLWTSLYEQIQLWTNTITPIIGETWHRWVTPCRVMKLQEQMRLEKQLKVAKLCALRQPQPKHTQTKCSMGQNSRK